MGFSGLPGDPYDIAMTRARAASAALHRAADGLAAARNEDRTIDIDELLHQLSEDLSR